MDIVIEAISAAQGIKIISVDTNTGACTVQEVKADNRLLRKALKQPQQAGIIKEMVKRGLKLPELKRN